MDAMICKPKNGKPIFQLLNLLKEVGFGLVKNHRDNVVRTTFVELPEIARFVNKYLDAVHLK